MPLQRQRKYKALSDVIVGGALLFPRGATFELGEQFGAALVKDGRVVEIAALEQPGRHKRRDMRADDDEK